MTEPWEDALDRLERGCERNGKRCINWHTYPYNVCLGCIDDNQFYHHQFSQGTMDAKGTATLRSTIERLTAERDKAQSDLEWANVTIEAMHLQQCPIAIVPPDECRAKADALCATQPKEDE